MITGAGNSQLPPVYGTLLGVQSAAADRLVAGMPLPAIPASAATPGLAVPAGGGMAGFSQAILGQLASLLARSGATEVQGTAPPWLAPGAAPPTAPPGASAEGGSTLADGVQRPGQPEMDPIGSSSGKARLDATSLPVSVSGVPAAGSLTRLVAALSAVTTGGLMANPATPVLRREVLRAMSGAGVPDGTAPATDARFDELVRRVKAMPVPELVAMAQAIMQQAAPAAVPAAVQVPPTPQGWSAPAVANGTEPAVSTATEPAVADASAAPVQPGVRQVQVASAEPVLPLPQGRSEPAVSTATEPAVASAEPVLPTPQGWTAPAVSSAVPAAVQVPPTPQGWLAPAVANGTEPAVATAMEPAVVAREAPASTTSGAPVAAPRAATPNPAAPVFVGSPQVGVTVEAVMVGATGMPDPAPAAVPALPQAQGWTEPAVATAPAAPVAVPAMPQWHAEPARFIEAGYAAPVPVTTVAVRQASAVPVATQAPGMPAASADPAGVSTDAGLRSIVERIYPTDTGLPQETAPAVPGPVGSAVIPAVHGEAPVGVVARSVAVTSQPGGPVDPSAPAAPPGPVAVQVAVAAPTPLAPVAVPSQLPAPAPVAAMVAAPAANLAAAAPAGNADAAVQPAVTDTLLAGPGVSAGQAGAAPAAPGTPGAVVQPGVVAGNAAPEGVAEPGSAQGSRRDDAGDPLEAALARAQGGMAADGGVSRPAGEAGTPSPAMGDAALRAALAQLSEEIPQTPPGGIREIELRLNSEELGRVRVRLKLLDTGAVAIEFTASTERAAQVLRNDLPQLAQALEGRGTTLDHPQVLVAPVGQFMGQGSSGQSRQGPRWFEHSPRRGAEVPEAVAAAATYGRRPRMVDVLA